MYRGSPKLLYQTGSSELSSILCVRCLPHGRREMNTEETGMEKPSLLGQCLVFAQELMESEEKVNRGQAGELALQTGF